MCGRFAQSRLARAHARSLLPQDHPPAPRPETWNLAPTTKALALRQGEAAVEADWLSWGFEGRAMRPINARIETAATKGFFASSWASRRCIVPADGWYEWRLETGKKQPYYFRRSDRKPLFLAGLWVKTTFCLITRDADGKLAEIHNRRPVALDDDNARQWCALPLTSDELLAKTQPASEIQFHPVSTRVSSPRNDGPDLIEPLAPSTAADKPFPNSL